MATIIESDTLIHTERSFKLSAGPGAGKTHWLTLHIKNVIANGKRLETARRIACISYTNVGADTVSDRLPNHSSIVDVSTIHSFLFANVVKPFLFLEAERWGLDPTQIRVVPIENYLTSAFAHSVLDYIGATWMSSECMLDGMRKCSWQYKDHRFSTYKPKYPIKAKNSQGKTTKYYIPQKAYDAFVRLRWDSNCITYDDVLYLAVELLELHPEIYNIVVARYPYFFIDEFQDSIPPIVDLVRCLGERNVIVGVVGDKAQSIYGFIGASVEQFDSFIVPNMDEYEIRGNRRSSPEIISLLNIVRPNFVQNSIATSHGSRPVLLIGDRLEAYQRALGIVNGEEVHTLAYPNIIANSMMYSTHDNVYNDLIDSDFDSNFERSVAIRSLLKATEYAFHGDLREAWRQMDAVHPDRAVTIGFLRILLNKRGDLLTRSLYDYFIFIKSELFPEMPNLRKGSIMDFYKSHSYRDMAVSMKVADCDALHKTIHKAKGEEYDNVLLIAGDDVSFLTQPDIDNNATQRVYYVGMSRARRNLFININKVSREELKLLSKMPLIIIYL